MKILFKMTFLILVCMSNFIFSVNKHTQVNSYIKKIIASHNCNCTKLVRLDDEQLSIAKFDLFMLPYETPKSEQELEKIEKDLIELFHDNLPHDSIKWRMKAVKRENEKMKCVKKMIETINELKKQRMQEVNPWNIE